MIVKPRKRMTAKGLFAFGFEGIVILGVLAFLAVHSINLFGFVFPPEQQYLRYLGFTLTGLAAIAYLFMFLFKAKTTLQKVVTLAMTVVCSLGEVLAALFGMQIEAWKKANLQMTEQDFQSMLMVIGILAIAHFLAFVLYYAGDRIIAVLKDEDGDGTPDAFDAIDNRTGLPFWNGFAPFVLPTPPATPANSTNPIPLGLDFVNVLVRDLKVKYPNEYGGIPDKELAEIVVRQMFPTYPVSENNNHHGNPTNPPRS